jgi:hypothetical protein
MNEVKLLSSEVRAERERIAEKIFHVLRHNNDERHVYPDPCLVCEILNELDELRIELEAENGE